MSAGKKTTKKASKKVNKKASKKTPKAKPQVQNNSNGQNEPLLKMPSGSQATLGGAWDVPRTESLVAQIGTTPLGASQLASLLGVVPSTVTTMTSEGMPSRGGGAQGRRAEYRLAEVLPWLVKRGGKRASIDSRDAVAREQAIKLARENALAEQELANVADVGMAIEQILVALNGQLDGLPGRLCGELAAQSADSAAVIRQRLRAGIWSARAAFAAELAQLAERVGHVSEDLQHSATAAEQNARSMGGRKQTASAH